MPSSRSRSTASADGFLCSLKSFLCSLTSSLPHRSHPLRCRHCTLARLRNRHYGRNRRNRRNRRIRNKPLGYIAERHHFAVARHKAAKARDPRKQIRTFQLRQLSFALSSGLGLILGRRRRKQRGRDSSAKHPKVRFRSVDDHALEMVGKRQSFQVVFGSCAVPHKFQPARAHSSNRRKLVLVQMDDHKRGCVPKHLLKVWSIGH
jgi:hypothetical protein